MKKFVAAAIAWAMAAMFLASAADAAPRRPGAARGEGAVGRPGIKVEVRSSGRHGRSYVAPEDPAALADGRTGSPASLTAPSSFEVTFDASFSPEAKAAFQRAVDLWSASISATVPITVNARWQNLGATTLGAAGPDYLWSHPTAPIPNSWYPVALYNQVVGHDTCPADGSCGGHPYDITATFNSANPNWYFGLDGATPSDKFDFVSVVLHELGHGLGFAGSMSKTGANGSWGSGTGLPFLFDRIVETAGGTSLLDTATYPNPSAALGSALTSGNLFGDSPALVAANGGRPKLYAPASWSSGSSISHWDESTYGTGDVNSLMTPLLDFGEAVHHPGPATLGLLDDFGWTVGPLQATPPPGVVQTTNLFVPDGEHVVSSLDVAEGQVGAVAVRLRAAHAYDADLEVRLESPSGTVVDLSIQNGPNGHGFGTGIECSGTPTIFRDDAPVAIGASSAPYAGPHRPDEALSVLAGEPAGGQWKLHLTDITAPDPGTLLCWGLEISPPLASGTRPSVDFDGNGVAEIAVYRPSSQAWFSAGGLVTGWGAPDDIPVPADYDGDGDTDPAVFRPSDQTWYVQGGIATQWGIPGDIPVPADYDGDGTDEIAVYRPSDQTWYSQTPGSIATQWGVPGDVPVPADYDGDGDDDVAIYRPADQTWYSQGVGGIATQWGITGDIPIPADFDGDGRADIAVYRPADQTWYSQSSGLATQWGIPGDQAAPDDHDGDGDADVTVYRPSDATWYSQGPNGIATQFGAPGDTPLTIPHHIRQLYA